MRSGAQWAAWLVTRGLLAVAALSSWYGDGRGPIRPWSDVELYAAYASLLSEGAWPYADIAIEYPAGSLPLLVAPGLLSAVPGIDYLAAFVACALALDLAGFVAARRLGTRWGSELGPWAWIAGIAVIGPVALLRLDLLPVVAVLWAAERAAAGRWGWAGGLVTLGATAKLWPAGLLPAAGVAAPRWRDVLAGALTVGGTVLLVTAPVAVPMLDAAVLRNLGRGLQVESLWGSLLLVLDALGLSEAEVTYVSGADHVSGPGAPTMVQVARVVPVAVVLLGAWLATRRVRPRARQYVHAAEAATLVLVAFAGILSVQFLLWTVGAMTAVACATGAATVRRRLVMVGAACVLTAVEFPWLYRSYTSADPLPVSLVVVRNLLLVAAAVDAVRAAMTQDAPVRPERSPAGA